MKRRHQVVLGLGAGLALTGSALVAPAVAHAATVGGAECSIVGTAGNDVLRGTPGDDVICGLGGNDGMAGGDGDDILSGGDGIDVLYGGSGDDTILGGGGDDVLYGAAGDDVLAGGSGDDVQFGGSGNDNLVGGAGTDTLVGGTGTDRLSESSTVGSQRETGGKVEMAARYSLPVGTEVHWTPLQDERPCIARTGESWTDTVGSEPMSHFLFEVEPTRACFDKDVNFRWRVRVHTPDDRWGLAYVLVSAKFSGTQGSPIPVSAATCIRLEEGLKCTRSITEQKFWPLLPLYSTVTIGPLG